MTANHAEVIATLTDYGLVVGDNLRVGTGIVRVPFGDERRGKTSGWYSLFEYVTKSGKRLITGAYGSWKLGDKQTISLKSRELDADEVRALREQAKARMTEAAEMKRAAQMMAAEKAARWWHGTRDVGESPYLAAKGIGKHGGKVSAAGNFVIPLLDETERITGLQVMLATPKHGRNKDFQPRGLRKKGCYYLIGIPRTVLLVCEGFATAASLNEATGLPCAVAFDAGNLLPVCEVMRKRLPNASIVVCADDDHILEAGGKVNVGIAKAQNAASAVGGVMVAPSFAERAADDSGKTDFNDLANCEGQHVVRRQIERALERAGLMPERQKVKLTPDFSLDALVNNYSLIFGTKTVFDHARHKIIPADTLALAAGREVYREWHGHPARMVVEPSDVDFDPVGDRNLKCNMFKAIAMQPQSPRGADARHAGGLAGVPDDLSAPIFELLRHICAAEDDPAEAYAWLLRWLAYPLQHVGAKMQTAVLVHGGQGSGKNTLFNVILKIYGEYGTVFNQHDMEDKYNDYLDARLFAVGNEVMARTEMQHMQGVLKNMITENEWQIRSKFLPSRKAQNCCNLVFFSNRADIARIDNDDRRFMVLWTPAAREEAFYKRVGEAMNNGGVEQFYWHLMNVALDGFNEHTKPPVTAAKQDLIDLSKDSVQVFVDWWAEGRDVPFLPCKAEHAYKMYQFIAREFGYARPLVYQTFYGTLKKQPGLGGARVRLDTGERVRVVDMPAITQARKAGITVGAWFRTSHETVHTAWRRYLARRAP